MMKIFTKDIHVIIATERFKMENGKKMTEKSKRGLAYASEETKQRVGSKGGSVPHKSRGLQSVDPERRKEIARLGGLARKRRYEDMKV